MQGKTLAIQVLQRGASEIYLNGKLIERYGTVSAEYDKEITYNPFGQPLSIQFSAEPVQVFAVRYSFNKKNVNLKTSGGTFYFYISTPDVAWRDNFYPQVTNSVIYSIIGGVIFIMCILHFFLYTAYLLLGICLLYLPYPKITSDKLLISIFGGFFLGVGTGLTMRAGCALDGIEVLALYTLKRSSFTITEIILGINVVIFVIAAFKFGLETSLYSILTYFTASQTINYVIEGIEAYTGVTIISGESEIIKQRLVNELGRGITVYKGERGFLPGKFEISNEVDIIFTVVTRLELRKLKNLVYDADPKAFVFANTIKETSGGIVKRRGREH